MIYLTWLGQGGYLLSNGGEIFAIDPYLSDTLEQRKGYHRIEPIPIPPQDVKAQTVFCTHCHLDHLDPGTIRGLEKDCIFAGPDSCCEKFRELGISQGNIKRFNRGDRFKKDGFVFTAAFARHTKDSIGIVVEYQGKRIYFTGDTLYHKELGERCDIIIPCINGRMGNLTPEEAAVLTLKCHAKLAIPSHYGMFRENTIDPQRFCEALANTKVRTMILRCGETVQIDLH